MATPCAKAVVRREPRIAPVVAVLLGLLAATPARADNAPSDMASRGLDLMKSHGCLACHTSDGTRGVGPTLLGYFDEAAGRGRERVLRALAAPDADVAAGYPAGTMPAYSFEPADAEAIVAGLAHLATARAVHERRSAEGSLAPLAIALAIFVFGHLLLSTRSIRGVLIARLGKSGFAGAFSLVALIGFGWAIWAYRTAPYIAMWTPRLWMRWIPLVVMPLSYILLVASLGLGLGLGGSKTETGPSGMTRVTRHPMLWAFALWSMSHLGPNGDVATTLWCVGLLVLAIAGMLHIDARHRHSDPEGWAVLSARTSLVPFMAIAQGRNRFRFAELWLPTVVGVVGYAAMLMLHEYVTGVSAMPY